MKPLKELIIGGIWAASAVQVAAYTWESFGAAGGWSYFPGLPGGEAQTTSQAAKAAGKESGGVVTKVRSAVGSVVGTVLSPLSGIPIIGGITKSIAGEIHGNPGGLSTADINRLNKLPNPPSALVTAVRKAQQGSAQQANAANALSKWATSHGWRVQDVTNYLKYIGVNIL